MPFSTNLSEVLVVTLGLVAAFLLDLRGSDGATLLPLTATQLRALALDRKPGVLQRLPRNPATPLLDATSLQFILPPGGVTALVAFATLGLLPWVLRQPLEVTQTATFLFLAAWQLLFAYPARHIDLRPSRNAVLHLAVG